MSQVMTSLSAPLRYYSPIYPRLMSLCAFINPFPPMIFSQPGKRLREMPKSHINIQFYFKFFSNCSLCTNAWRGTQAAADQILEATRSAFQFVGSTLSDQLQPGNAEADGEGAVGSAAGTVEEGIWAEKRLFAVRADHPSKFAAQSGNAFRGLSVRSAGAGNRRAVRVHADSQPGKVQRQRVPVRGMRAANGKTLANLFSFTIIFKLSQLTKKKFIPTPSI